MAVLALVTATLAYAHEGHQHLMGVVMSLDAKHLEVKNQEGEVVSVRLSDATRYFRDGAQAKISDIAVGSRVVVDLAHEGDQIIASEVRIGTPTKPAAQKK